LNFSIREDSAVCLISGTNNALTNSIEQSLQLKGVIMDAGDHVYCWKSNFKFMNSENKKNYLEIEKSYQERFENQKKEKELTQKKNFLTEWLEIQKI